ncbi:dihydrofolate reductase family protein [Streptococcus gallinaceus]|uniref:Dihydrofolate reductase n=1 Tax=Streptococcus gallinaceus TaxID=165758 RepID=A0ABV2JIP9_9STRE|nr:dihydrofolate reductase family protein [Streptococcus gallinaceus]MCP1638709.1 dihydrofolate reductase [Streptococcus gallinaceus]MCP1769204.1 dihydrofolate reductase [Streptococcus gallinaceus]CRH90623.1 5-amino-6-(5-phosphoribosylamino)uracil reductase [Chlamydia trachomatis]
MSEVIAYFGVSLDGYLATVDESVEWLETVEGEGDNGYGDFYQSIGTVLMGRTTYDWIAERMQPFPYPDKTNYVFTSRQADEQDTVKFVNSSADAFVSDLKLQSSRDIWLCGGGTLFSSLLKAGLIDQIRVTLAPVILGQGISLYQDLVESQDLQLLEMRRHGQFVELMYKVEK